MKLLTNKLDLLNRIGIGQHHSESTLMSNRTEYEEKFEAFKLCVLLHDYHIITIKIIYT